LFKTSGSSYSEVSGKILMGKLYLVKASSGISIDFEGSINRFGRLVMEWYKKYPPGMEGSSWLKGTFGSASF
jgi:hypothetical protein